MKNILLKIFISTLLFIIGIMFTSCSFIPNTCKTCNGDGKYTAIGKFGIQYTETCKDCNGTGKESMEIELINSFIPFGIVVIIFIIYINVYKKYWTYDYNDNTIVVIITTSTGELIINGQTFDKKTGLSLQKVLQGKLKNEEEVIAQLGSGFFFSDCNLKVDGKIIPHIKK